MNGLRFACCDEGRRSALVGHATLNGIDFLEVGHLDAGQVDAGDARQRRLTLHLVNPLTSDQQTSLDSATLRVIGGERVRDVRAQLLEVGAQSLVVRTSMAGDFSRYTLEIERSATDPRPPAGFDPILSRIDFSFKVDCPSEFDCRRGHVCVRGERPGPEIDYLAKDYASFRRLMLDRLSLLLPDWRERSPADMGVALVELLAYAGDQLSYEQDAIATEAYLDTARLRTSVRRHALLVDYAMHDGCSARVFVFVEVNQDATLAPSGLRCLTAVEGLPRVIAPATPAARLAAAAPAEWFEPVVPELDREDTPDDLQFFTLHNEMPLYAWGDEQCCLPQGATRATLEGHFPQLREGMLLLFEEVIGPRTGEPGDANPSQRHVVRLTDVAHSEAGEPLVDPLDATEITNVTWHEADALPFPICISSRTADAKTIDGVAVARGNIVLVDHGRSVRQGLGSVPVSRLLLDRQADDWCASSREPVPPRFRPPLDEGPLSAFGTVIRPGDTASGQEAVRLRFDPRSSAAAAFEFEMRDVRPAIELLSELAGDAAPTPWLPVRDLLDSRPNEAHFVVETEHDGHARLRFGDGQHGRRPRPDEAFSATYRVGNGRAGNIGADSIRHAITSDGRIEGVRNPLPARGGVDAETAEEVRRRAPYAFRSQQRAVTEADYEAMTRRHPGVQRAAATLRWTGSWHTVFLTVDRFDGRRLDAALERELAEHVERYRLAGHDLEFDDPRFVPLELDLFVCVQPDYFRADVKARLLEVLSSRELPDGRRGLFHPDRFSFGQTVYLSPILAAVRHVPGVASARALSFQRQGVDEPQYLAQGRLPLQRLEIARLDNDPDFPERGALGLELSGGK
jgi:hypothetical protein